MIEKSFEEAKKEFKKILIIELIAILIELALEVWSNPSSLVAVIILGIVVIVSFVFLGILPAKNGKIVAGIFGLAVSIWFLTGGWFNIIIGVCFLILSINYLYRWKKNK